MTRHEFLAELHRRLRPKVYLEVGVQFGTSLNLAHAAELAIGIDPQPLTIGCCNQQIMTQTSDEWFAMQTDSTRLVVDLAFIDGNHHFEFVLRDFMNIERYCHPGSVVVFDDVMPRNQYEARRLAPEENIVGDWTGDAWKVIPVLAAWHPGDVWFRKIDTEPTGLLVVSHFPKAHLPWSLAGDIIDQWTREMDVPDDVLTRTGAWNPGPALDLIEEEIKSWRS